MVGITTKRYSSTRPSPISCEGTSTPPTKISLPCSCFSLSISSRRFVRTILVFSSSALANDREKTIFFLETKVEQIRYPLLSRIGFLRYQANKEPLIDRFYAHRRAGQNLARGACSVHQALRHP